MDDKVTCPICFAEPEIFAIGKCDHAICHVCCVKMRVLCENYDCVLCRQNIPTAFLATRLKPYKELQRRVKDNMQSKGNILFENDKTKSAYLELLKHKCKSCKLDNFDTFDNIAIHLLDVHNLHFCGICNVHFKTFTFEKPVYTKSELEAHCSGNDKDTNFQGHPKCPLCGEDHVDKANLESHMRRVHFFCHICDRERNIENRFFLEYKDLKVHYRSAHFLCERGECALEYYTSVFRTKKEYREHVESRHGHEPRRYELMRIRSPHHNPSFYDVMVPGLYATGLPRREYMVHPPEAASTPSVRSLPPLNEWNEELFPSLSGASVTLPRTEYTQTRRNNTLQLTEDAFPSLPGASTSNSASSIPSTSTGNNVGGWSNRRVNYRLPSPRETDTDSDSEPDFRDFRNPPRFSRHNRPIIPKSASRVSDVEVELREWSVLNAVESNISSINQPAIQTPPVMDSNNFPSFGQSTASTTVRGKWKKGKVLPGNDNSSSSSSSEVTKKKDIQNSNTKPLVTGDTGGSSKATSSKPGHPVGGKSNNFKPNSGTVKTKKKDNQPVDIANEKMQNNYNAVVSKRQEGNNESKTKEMSSKSKQQNKDKKSDSYSVVAKIQENVKDKNNLGRDNVIKVKGEPETSGASFSGTTMAEVAKKTLTESPKHNAKAPKVKNNPTNGNAKAQNKSLKPKSKLNGVPVESKIEKTDSTEKLSGNRSRGLQNNDVFPKCETEKLTTSKVVAQQLHTSQENSKSKKNASNPETKKKVGKFNTDSGSNENVDANSSVSSAQKQQIRANQENNKPRKNTTIPESKKKDSVSIENVDAKSSTQKQQIGTRQENNKPRKNTTIPESKKKDSVSIGNVDENSSLSSGQKQQVQTSQVNSESSKLNTNTTIPKTKKKGRKFGNGVLSNDGAGSSSLFFDDQDIITQTEIARTWLKSNENDPIGSAMGSKNQSKKPDSRKVAKEHDASLNWLDYCKKQKYLSDNDAVRSNNQTQCNVNSTNNDAVMQEDRSKDKEVKNTQKEVDNHSFAVENVVSVNNQTKKKKKNKNKNKKDPQADSVMAPLAVKDLDSIATDDNAKGNVGCNSRKVENVEFISLTSDSVAETNNNNKIDTNSSGFEFGYTNSFGLGRQHIGNCLVEEHLNKLAKEREMADNAERIADLNFISQLTQNCYPPFDTTNKYKNQRSIVESNGSLNEDAKLMTRVALNSHNANLIQLSRVNTSSQENLEREAMYFFDNLLTPFTNSNFTSHSLNQNVVENPTYHLLNLLSDMRPLIPTQEQLKRIRRPPGLEHTLPKGYDIESVGFGNNAGEMLSKQILATVYGLKDFLRIREVFSTKSCLLLVKIVNSLIKQTDAAILAFSNTTISFQEDRLSYVEYYIYCKNVMLPEDFKMVFLQIILFFPNVYHQQNLLALYKKDPENSWNSTNLLDSCPHCYVVTWADELDDHIAEHAK